jgi:CheY-like chemotaxis protein
MKKVLVVDDDRLARGAMKRALLDEGFEILEAEDGKQALEIAKKNKPDVIVTDLQMPHMNGQELIDAVRSESWGVRLPIVMLTAAENNEVINQALESEVIYFSKGIASIDEVVNAVSEMV